MKTLSTKGIILRRVDYGEADRILTFLTPDYGKIHVIAKGVRKSKSKLAGGIELFSVSEIHFIKGKSGMGTLTSTRLVRHYGNIVKDLVRTDCAYAMLKRIDKVVEDETGQEYFEVLNESLAALDNQAIYPELAEASYVMRVLALLGYAPDFSVDASGAGLNPEDTFDFDFETGLFRPSPKGQFSKNHIKVLRLLAHNSPAKMAAVQGIYDYIEAVKPVVQGIYAKYVA